MRIFLLFKLVLVSSLSPAQTNPLAKLVPENCFNNLDDDGDGYIDCYDIDCQCFDPPACSMVIPPNTDISIQPAWQSQNFKNNFSTGSGITLVGNLNPQSDSIPEILVTSSHNSSNSWDIRFFRGDGSNANASDSLELVKGLSNVTEPVIGDVDGDGIPELIVSEWDSYLRVYRNFTPGANPVMSHWITASNKLQGGESRPMLADMDGDGTSEIVVDNEVFIFDFSDPAAAKLRKVLDGGNNNPYGKQYYSLNYVPTTVFASPAVADLLTPTDCNGDPDCDGLEIAAGPVIYSIDLDTMDGDGYQIKIQRDLNFLESPDVFGDGYTAVADMNIDGIPDVVVLGRGKVDLDPAQLGVYVWNKNGLLRYMKIPLADSIWGRFFCLPLIANVFDDTKRGHAKDFPEVVFSTTQNMYAYNLHANNFPDITAWWFLPIANPNHFTEVSATAFDFNGDSFSEIVFYDDIDLRIIYGGHFPFPPGVDAKRNWASIAFPDNNSGLTRYPVIADVDNDGQAEIITCGAMGDPSIGRPIVNVFESAGLPWPPCRNVWNQYNYNIVNIEDDLGVPIQQQKQWLEFPSPGSGKRPLNMALGQRGPLNGAVLLPLADLNCGVDTFFCDKDSLRLWLRVCNNGNVPSPAGLSLQWYAGDPTAVGATLFGTSHLFQYDLAKDACAVWNISVPLPPNGTFYGIINDNGSLSGPIDLEMDFPSTNIDECNYLNNLFSIDVSYSSPALELGPDQSICKDATTVLNANPGFSRYRWQDGTSNATFIASGAGIYWVDAWDICGNLFSDTLRLLAIPTPTLALGSDVSLCSGDSIAFTTTGFDNVVWTSAGNTVCAACPSFSISPTTSPITIQATAQSGICFERDTITISILALPQITGQAVETHCGNEDGSINILINSNLPYQIQWSDGQTIADLSGLAAATYTVTVTDQAGCSQTDTYQVAASTAVTLNSAILTNVLCFGEQTGSISISINSGTTPYQFNWSTGQGTEDLDGLPAGSYSITVIDDLGCADTSTYQITEPPQLIIQSNLDGTSCASTTADISLNPLGGVSPYFYTWDGGQNTPVINDLLPGVYTVSVTDTNGCETVQTFDIQPGGSPVLSISMLSPALCFGENSGAISVDATLGLSPYQFNWSTGLGTNVLNNLAAGMYDLTVTDANGCTANSQYVVTEPPPLQLLSTVNPTSCLSSTADISVDPQGGILPYNFIWNGGQNTPVLNNVVPGIYTVTVTDANACETIQVFDIQSGGSPVLSAVMLNPVLCFGENTGAISVDPTLGTPPYQFTWSTGTGTNTLNNLFAGNYGLTVTDGKGCTVSSQYMVTEPPQLGLLYIVDSTSCISPTADITVTPQGGTSPYNINWNGGQNIPVLYNVVPGEYTVSVTDINGCEAIQVFDIQPGGSPALSIMTLDPIRCFGEITGAISAEVTLGVPPYIYNWSTGAGSNTLSNLAAGNYSLTVTDANGCTINAQYEVTEPLLLQLSSTVDPTTCTSSTGNISVTPQGGISPYSYLWNTGQSTASISDLQPGDYSIMTTDSNGCSTSETFSILPGGPPALSSSMVMPVTCFGDSDGKISVQVSGGNLPYQFDWSNGQGNSVLDNLSAGVYQLTISDANACTSVASFLVETPLAMTASLTTVSDTCKQFTGSITVASNGGIAPYTYLWSDGSITKDRLDIPAGTFQLIVTDANGCTFTEDTEVLSVDIMPAFSIAGDTITCTRSSVDLGPIPAPSNWIFEWQTPTGALLAGAVQTFIEPGPYSITATNNFGCTATQSIDILIDTIRPKALVAASNMFIPCGQFVAILDGSGSSTGAFYEAQWYQEINGQLVWDTLALVAQTSLGGDFILQITDLTNGCTEFDTVQVQVAESIKDVVIAVDSISCFGLEDGAILVESISGGTAPYLYALQNQSFNSVFTFTDLSQGAYTLFVQDANGCEWQSAALSIIEPAPLSLNLTASDTRIDLGESVLLQADIQPSGAILNEILWSPPAYFSLAGSLAEIVQPTETTLFRIEVEDANGCMASDTARVHVRREAIYIPNVFQPGSPGNGSFTVFAATDILEVQLLQVYDRWGEQLFEKRHFSPNDSSEGWDGTFRGKPIGPGVYVYHVVVEVLGGRIVELNGNVTVVY